MVFHSEFESISPIAPARLFKALVLDAETLLPKVLPQFIQSIQILEGDGGVGTIKLTTFVGGSHVKKLKTRVDELDKENFVYKYTLLEGVYGDGVESINNTLKVEASGDGGSVIKYSSVYNTKGDAQIDEELLKSGKEKSSGIYKALEGYLIANPDYN